MQVDFLKKTNYLVFPGFENYHKIAVRDHVRVPKFWRT